MKTYTSFRCSPVIVNAARCSSPPSAGAAEASVPAAPVPSSSLESVFLLLHSTEPGALLRRLFVLALYSVSCASNEASSANGESSKGDSWMGDSRDPVGEVENVRGCGTV